MRALLLYPEFPRTFWSHHYALKFIGKKAVAPPLGLLTVAAMLPASWSLRLVDLNVRPLRASDLAWADVALISAMGVQREAALAVIARCREAGIRTVAGGPLFTSQPEQFGMVDHLVLNEAELTLPPFLRDLAADEARHIYRADAFADLSLSPVPRFDLADLRQYAQAPLQYSRGCPFDCEFCDVTALFGRRPRVKRAAQVLAELAALSRRRWRGSVFFVDDNLIGARKKMRDELLPSLVEYQRDCGPVEFNSQVSIDVADDPQLLAQMARAGFTVMFIGIETPDPEALLECHKTQNVHRDLLADVRKIQAAGIQVQGGFILGFDHDSPGSFQRLVDFVQASGIATAMVGLLQALTGTRLYERMKRESRLRAESTGDNVGGSNIVPRMGSAALERGYAEVLRSLYSPKGYYERVRTFLQQFHKPQVKARLQPRYLLAFAAAAVRLGIVGRERLRYWRLLAWTATHRPTLLPTAVHLAILGHHYRRVCWQYLRQARAAATPSA